VTFDEALTEDQRASIRAWLYDRAGRSARGEDCQECGRYLAMPGRGVGPTLCRECRKKLTTTTTMTTGQESHR